MRSSLLGIIALVVPIMLLTGLSIMTAGYSPNAAKQSGPTPTVWPFDPALYDVPDEVAGYRVLAVVSAENTMCVPPRLLTLIVRAESPSPQEYLASNEKKSLDAAMKAFSHPGWTWVLNVVGPKMSLDTLQVNTERWNETMRISGCLKLGRIILEVTPTPLP